MMLIVCNKDIMKLTQVQNECKISLNKSKIILCSQQNKTN